MKTERIKFAKFDNRKRILKIDYASGKSVQISYRQLSIKKNIAEVWIDKETRGKALGIRFGDQTEEFMPYDQPLALVKDPQYLLRVHIERVVAKIKQTLAQKKISKRYLAEQLGTSDNQVQRLLNPEILNKNLEQLYKIATLLGLEFDWRLKRAG